MTTATSNAPATVTRPALNPWRRVLRLAAAATIVLSVAHQWLNRFFGISLVALAVLLAVGLLLDLSQRRAGPVLLAATSLLFLVLHVAILVLVLRYVDIAETFITVWGLVVGLSLTLAAAIQTLRSHSHSTNRSATVVAIVACAAWVAVGAYSLAARMDIENVQPGPGDVVVDVSDGPPTAPNLDLQPGPTSVVFHNLDDSPLLIESTAGHLQIAIPAHYSRRVDLDLDDGTYRYTIDGPDKRITGTLTVS
jgi:hypothetical protein